MRLPGQIVCCNSPGRPLGSKLKRDKRAVKAWSQYREVFKLKTIADIVELTPQAVGKWKTCSLEHAKKISDHYGIPIEKLRPDVYDTKTTKEKLSKKERKKLKKKQKKENKK